MLVRTPLDISQRITNLMTRQAISRYKIAQIVAEQTDRTQTAADALVKRALVAPEAMKVGTMCEIFDALGVRVDLRLPRGRKP